MKIYSLVLVFLISSFTWSQIKGTVTDKKNEPLPFVNIYVENSSIGTTSNEKGEYILNIREQNAVIVFQSLGYRTEKRHVQASNHSYRLDVVLSEENFILDEVVVSNKDNPANAIIRNAIKNKTKNSEITYRFEADFYSKGIFKVKNLPKKILGQEVGDLGGTIDSVTRSGIVYQSETISKIKFEKPNNVKEHILASKVAGDSNGFSFNTAQQANFDFYDNFLNFDVKVVSPIADNAFNYYTFQLENTFYDDQKHLINKIKVLPKRDKEAVFEGYIYIVEDSWAIYGIDLLLKGYRMQNPAIVALNIVQNFNFDSKNNVWNKKLQTLSIDVDFFMIKMNGNFSYVYNNYLFKESFAKKEFSTEIRSFANNANKKDSLFWVEARQIPLTLEEKKNYIKRDSVELIKTSKKYLDSIDAKNNRFKLFDIITGYSHTNTAEKRYFNYEGFLGLESMSFNTVQGYVMGTSFSFRKQDEEKSKNTYASVDLQYGFAEKKLRVKGSFNHTFNRIFNPFVEISGGSEVKQFNANNPISAFVNDISTLFFKDNYMKLYHNEFLGIGYGRDLTKDVSLYTSLYFSNRKPLWNNTNYSFIKTEKPYTSNNPLLPNDYETNFQEHYITRFSLVAKFHINQKYMSLPNRRIKIPDARYPDFTLRMDNTFSASEKRLQYQHISGAINYTPSFDNKGEMSININGGTFFNAKNINFIDYKHFNGNQTHFYTGRGNDSFNLLPYYTNSTNERYLQTHVEHRFRGFISNKIPLFNKLQWNFVAGFHQLNTKGSAPYQEFTLGLENIGFGKFRFLRIDYVRSYQNGFKGDGFMFGINLF